MFRTGIWPLHEYDSVKSHFNGMEGGGPMVINCDSTVAEVSAL
jgi:hypothetical protein